MPDSTATDFLLKSVRPVTVRVPARIVAETAAESWAKGMTSAQRADDIVRAVWSDVVAEAAGDIVRLRAISDSAVRVAGDLRGQRDVAIRRVYSVQRLRRLRDESDSSDRYVLKWQLYHEAGWPGLTDIYVFDWAGPSDAASSEELVLVELADGHSPELTAHEWVGYGPVPLAAWVDTEARAYTDWALSVASVVTLEDVRTVARERATTVTHELEVVAVRSSIARALVGLAERVGMAALSTPGPGSERPLVHVRVEHADDRRDRLRLSRDYVVVAAVDLIHEGRAKGWKDAHTILTAEVQADDSGSVLIYKSDVNLKQAAKRTYFISVDEAKEKGRLALANGVVSDAEAWG